MYRCISQQGHDSMRHEQNIAFHFLLQRLSSIVIPLKEAPQKPCFRVMSQNQSPAVVQIIHWWLRALAQRERGYIQPFDCNTVASRGCLRRFCSSAHRLLWLSPHAVRSPSTDNWRPLQRRLDAAHCLQLANSSLRLREGRTVKGCFFIVRFWEMMYEKMWLLVSISVVKCLAQYAQLSRWRRTQVHKWK